MKASIYVNREDVRHVEADEKYNFIRGVIELLELPLEDCFPEGDSVALFTVENKINLRKSLRKYDLTKRQVTDVDAVVSNPRTSFDQLKDSQLEKIAALYTAMMSTSPEQRSYEGRSAEN